MPVLSSLLSLHRIRLLLRQADCAFEQFYALWQDLRHVPGSWPDLVLSDLEALWKREVKLSSMPDPRVNVDAWVKFMQQNRGLWKKILRSNLQCYVGDEPVVPVQVEAICPFQCGHCAERFSSKAKCSSHEHLKHGVLSLAGQWAVGRSTCPACCMQFHAPERLARHFKQQRRCLVAVVAFFPAPNAKEEEEKTATTVRRRGMKSIGRTTEFADVPAWRVSGPRLPVVNPLPLVERRGPAAE